MLAQSCPAELTAAVEPTAAKLGAGMRCISSATLSAGLLRAEALLLLC